MRFFKSVVLAATAVGVIASQAAAQTPVNVTVNISNNSADHVYKAQVGSNLGGGWKATITGIPGGLTLTEPPIVYCFDNQRQFNYNQNMTYTLLTFSDFLANKAVGGGTVPGGRDAQWNTINLQDLNSMAALAGTYVSGGPNAYNNGVQGSIWDISNNVTPGSYVGPNLNQSWMILVDAAEWAGGYDKNPAQGKQSFLVKINNGSQVPEPSSIALMVAGIAGLVVVSRRRVNS